MSEKERRARQQLHGKQLNMNEFEKCSRHRLKKCRLLLIKNYNIIKHLRQKPLWSKRNQFLGII